MRFKIHPRMELWENILELQLLVKLGVIKEHSNDWHFEIVSEKDIPSYILDKINKIRY